MGEEEKSKSSAGENSVVAAPDAIKDEGAAHDESAAEADSKKRSHGEAGNKVDEEEPTPEITEPLQVRCVK